jgi:hypothetical protein
VKLGAGAKPSAVGREAAAALGVTVPPSLLAAAAEVIE